MGEQESTTSAQEPRDFRCRHPEAAGIRWGDPISEERQAELEAWVVEQQDWLQKPQMSRCIPCSQLRLTGADIFWLSERARDRLVKHLDTLEEGVSRAGIFELLKPDIAGMILHLEGAVLIGAHLEGANLSEAHLEDATLQGAHLEGAELSDARLEGADLSEAALDEDTNLAGAFLGPDPFRDWLDQLRSVNHNAALVDVKWREANLTSIHWTEIRRLGDEREAEVFKLPGEAARAYRLVANQLRAQGINEAADRFAYRAQIWQGKAYRRDLLDNWRRPWRWPGDALHYVGSLFLAVLAGYGYRPGRTLFWYVMTLVGFMWGYLQVTHGASFFGLTEPPGTAPLHWYEALVLSVASFHGRGFFPQGISLGDPVAILAASEAVVGLFIEVSFIATFTQRYFGR